MGDITDNFDKLKTTLKGVDILISAVVGWLIAEQKDIIRAAKEVGVGRVIPCDFATPGAKGVRALHDAVRLPLLVCRRNLLLLLRTEFRVLGRN